MNRRQVKKMRKAYARCEVLCRTVERLKQEAEQAGALPGDFSIVLRGASAFYK